jgi:DNA-binding Lrp family transcriptional regulator
MINHRALGMASTLVAAHIPEENLQEVAEAVNSLENVSHNYLREHYYNLWFTLQAESPKQIEVAVSNLSGRFGIDFYSLPIKRVFKLDVRFDVEGEGRLPGDIEQVPKSEVVKLNKTEKQILWELEDDLDVISEPFDFLCSEGLETEEVLRIIQGLIDKGVIRRIAAIVDHRKLGFVTNVLFCSEVPRNRIVEAGEALARFGAVSHCYERKTVEDWPYNLFAMMHGKSMGEIQHVINKFTESEKIDSFELLPTAAELKKQPVKHRFY